jgi:hypothetical protein
LDYTIAHRHWAPPTRHRGRVAHLPLKGGGEKKNAPSPLEGEGWDGGYAAINALNSKR